MASTDRVKVGIIGSQFEAEIQAESFRIMPDEAEVVAVASPTPGHAATFAKRFGIPRVFNDYREMLAERDIEMVTIAAPNALHCQMTLDIANAGKHVVCEKPLCMTLEEADLMLETCRRQGVLLLYAEELFFTWNYGFPQEMHHFARCVRGKETPQATGEDGRLVQEVLYAAYHSAGTGQKVTLPFRPAGVKRPIDLWRKPVSA